MNAQETLNQWLSDYGQTEGIDGLALDEYGVCGISYQDGDARHVLNIEQPANADAFFLTGSVVECDSQNRDTVLTKALTLNLDAEVTRGAAFALDGSRLLLSYSRPVEACDSVEFGNLLNNFVAVLDGQRRAFDELQTETAAPQEIAPLAFPMAGRFGQFA